MENEKKGRKNKLKWELVRQTHETIPSPKANNNNNGFSNSLKNKTRDEKNQSLKSTKNEKN